MTDGWCESCGKRLPYSYASHAKETGPKTGPEVIHAAPSRWMLWSGVIGLILLTSGVLIAISVMG